MVKLVEIGENLKIGINPENQQLVSLKLNGKEFFHGGGKEVEDKNSFDKKGWKNSEIIMFPIVGAPINYELFFKKDSYPMDQHGVSRCLPFKYGMQTENTIFYLQTYSKEDVKNIKYKKDNGRPEFISMPYNYVIRKSFSVSDVLNVEFIISNNSLQEMPYEFGWHPAFRLLDDGVFKVGGKTYTLEEVQKASKSNCLQAEGEKVVYSNGDNFIEVSSDMRNWQIWSPGHMVCIEPVTAFGTEDGIRGFKEPYTNSIMPKEKKEYSVTIKVG